MVAESKLSVLYIVGATATGKTDLALEVSRKTGWPIINFDSVQAYQRVDIGAAKPTSAEMKECPHYLFDIVPPPQELTVASYLEHLKRTLPEVKSSGMIFVGGSGFYMQAIEKGVYQTGETSQTVKDEVSALIDQLGYEQVFAWIEEQDPTAAAKISPNDHYRVRRAAEILKSSSKTITELLQQTGQAHSILPPHRSLKIGLSYERESHRKKVQLRTEKMLAAGWIKEVEGLLDAGLMDWAPLKSVGYRELVRFINSEPRDLSRLRDEVVTSTMQLCKKQRTWFQRDQQTQWFSSEERDKALTHILDWASL